MKKKNKGFVVSAILYPLLVLFLALIMGLLAMTDTRKRILDKMKLEISDSIFDDAECSCDTILNKLNYLIKNGVSGGGGGGSYSHNVLGLSVKAYETPEEMPNVGNGIGDIAVITDVEIANYYVSSAPPDEPKHGTVWIIQDRITEYYIKSDYSKIGITYVMQNICDDAGKNCEWQLKKAYYFDEAKWNLLYYVPVLNGEIDLTSSDINAQIVHTFDYKGEYQTFTARFAGYYQVELWGAQGGTYGSGANGGLGAYTYGKIYLNAGQRLFVYVGGTGKNPDAYDVAAGGGWNGGGNGLRASNTGNNIGAMGGGGSTDIRLEPTSDKKVWNEFDSLKTRIMVAAGGSGSARYNGSYFNGSAGGGLNGYDGTCNGGGCNPADFYAGKGATQAMAGRSPLATATAGGFGYGGDGIKANYNSTGGGGGYYGGGGAYAVGAGGTMGGGGSSYISGFNGVDSIDKDSTSEDITHTGSAYHYSGFYFIEPKMIDGNGYEWDSYHTSGKPSQPTTNGTSTQNGKSGNGYAKITLLTVEYHNDKDIQTIQEDSEDTWSYIYSGNYQVFTAPFSGRYQTELWGAQGGTYGSSANGGLGSYTKGTIYLEKGTKLYVYVGGQGSNPQAYDVASGGGWNGGGNGLRSSNTENNIGAMGGGGSTDIRLMPTTTKSTWNGFESLKSRIMVAAGGSGSARHSGSYFVGVAGGGLNGYDGTCNGGGCSIDSYNGGTGGTQNKAGASPVHTGTTAGFGYGGNGVRSNYNSTGGGGGYYGGSGAYAVGNAGTMGASGSSYISGFEGVNSIDESSILNNIVHTGSAYHYSEYYFTDTKMIDGNGYEWNRSKAESVQNQPNYDGNGKKTGNSGNGYAKVTLLDKSTSKDQEVIDIENKWVYTFNGNYQTFKAPHDGYYSIQLWGAQGGSHISAGGLGAYTDGKIYLQKGTKLYVYVGGQGTNPTAYQSLQGGGWNGGGNGNRHNSSYSRAAAGGGGSTDVRLVSTSTLSTWNNFDSLKSRIMVAAGGSGSTNWNGTGYVGAAGGGLIGYDGLCDGGGCRYFDFAAGKGATQNLPGISYYYENLESTTTKAGFGYGGNAGAVHYNGSGGGGGYYGGGGGSTYNWTNTTGGGGSSYISGFNGVNSIEEESTSEEIVQNSSKYHYSGYYFTDMNMIDGNGYAWNDTKATELTKQPTHDEKGNQTGNGGSGYAIIKLLEKKTVSQDVINEARENGQEKWNYTYSGKYEKFTSPTNGYYSVQLWGAQGGTGNVSGGNGAYTSGKIYLEKGTDLYVYVGRQGFNPQAYDVSTGGGWNGGGNGLRSSNTSNNNLAAGGGGSTDVRLVATSDRMVWKDFSSLKSRIMVAAGGSGAAIYSSSNYSGVPAGGLTGTNGTCDGSGCDANTFWAGQSATQTMAGSSPMHASTLGGFGYGGNGVRYSYNSTGGGGGYYGGGGAYAGGNGGTMGGSGSSYISGYAGCNSISESSTLNNITHTGSIYHYSGYYFTDTQMKAGNATTVPNYDGSGMQTGNSGNGYATIQLVEKTTEDATQIEQKKTNGDTEWKYTYNGNYQTFIAPANGYYSIQLWGAQGGSYGQVGGLGAYTYGEIYLQKNKKLYVYVGGQGDNPTAYQTPQGGGWNGGGNGMRWNTSYSGVAEGGGGATDVRLQATSELSIWNEFDSLKSRIMVAAGGSGVANYNGSEYPGAAGGGLNGYNGTCNGGGCQYWDDASGWGGTQTGPGYSKYYKIQNSLLTLGGFGYGGDGGKVSYSGSGGGGGYYGGGGASTYNWGSTVGGGGASYISGLDGCNSISSDSTMDSISHTGDPYHYSGYYFKNAVMIDGNGYQWSDARATTSIKQPNHNNTGTQTGNSGHGYAIIKLLQKTDKTSQELADAEVQQKNIWTYKHNGKYQVFEAPKTGTYSIELWGAQGGTSTSAGGLGAYTKGDIVLTKGTKLYVYVGGQGTNPTAYGVLQGGGWNGGGDGNRGNSSYSRHADGGGGATDIRTKVTSGPTVWKDNSSLASRIMVAAGGSGSSNWNGGTYEGVAAGGLVGYTGMCDASECTTYGGTGGTQTSGGWASVNKTATLGGFGIGGSATIPAYSASGGGGGWYGGGGSGGQSNGCIRGGGGSSYISGHEGCIGVSASGSANNTTYETREDSISNTGYAFTNTVMVDGKGYQWTLTKGTTVEKQPNYDNSAMQVGNSGDGYAKITYLGE